MENQTILGILPLDTIWAKKKLISLSFLSPPPSNGFCFLFVCFLWFPVCRRYLIHFSWTKNNLTSTLLRRAMNSFEYIIQVPLREVYGKWNRNFASCFNFIPAHTYTYSQFQSSGRMSKFSFMKSNNGKHRTKLFTFCVSLSNKVKIERNSLGLSVHMCHSIRICSGSCCCWFC